MSSSREGERESKGKQGKSGQGHQVAGWGGREWQGGEVRGVAEGGRRWDGRV